MSVVLKGTCADGFWRVETEGPPWDYLTFDLKLGKPLKKKSTRKSDQVGIEPTPKYSASPYDERVMGRCGLVDKASARRAENPGSNPGAGDNFSPEARVFENKVLRKIFGAKRDEVTGEWRKLHNTELHALYSSPDIIRNIKSRRLRWAGHVARMGESRNAYRVLVGRPEGKRPLGRPRRRWEDNIKMDLREVGYDDRDWINLAQDRDRWRAYSSRTAALLYKYSTPHRELYTGYGMDDDDDDDDMCINDGVLLQLVEEKTLTRKTSEKTELGNQSKRESNPRQSATPDQHASALADWAALVTSTS
ncbi:hypothetical protein ANN_13481 [Periplaneta americana]|uniref:Uncharacterized protein n=1 Tax=Periplaneta americana TaxID=6978 RepID=A0ABQ8TKI1_PERAM|nr:hypothetical protein ANN_13481 [Periplaneta americana]